MSKLISEIGRAVKLSEANTSAEVFSDLIRFRMLATLEGSSPVPLAKAAGRDRAAELMAGMAGTRPRELLQKAAVGASDTANTSALVAYQTAANAWLALLRNVSAFDRMLPDMLNVPPRTRIAVSTAGATAFSVGEGSAQPITSIAFSFADLSERRAVAWAAASKELIRLVGAPGNNLIEQELKQAVAQVTDQAFVDAITFGLTPMASAGSTVSAIRRDLAELLHDVQLGAGSKPYLLTTAKICKAWSLSALESGAPAFPDMGAMGGSIVGVPVVPSEGVSEGYIVLVDAAGIAAYSQTIELDILTSATVQMAAPADSPPTGSTVITSLWQQDLVALAASRWFAAARARPNSVAFITGAQPSGDSP